MKLKLSNSMCICRPVNDLILFSHSLREKSRLHSGKTRVYCSQQAVDQERGENPPPLTGPIFSNSLLVTEL